MCVNQFNFVKPQNSDIPAFYYVHRCGRTGPGCCVDSCDQAVLLSAGQFLAVIPERPPELPNLRLTHLQTLKRKYLPQFLRQVLFL